MDRDGHLNPSEFRAMLLEDVHPDEVRRPVRATHARAHRRGGWLARPSAVFHYSRPSDGAARARARPGISGWANARSQRFSGMRTRMATKRCVCRAGGDVQACATVYTRVLATRLDARRV